MLLQPPPSAKSNCRCAAVFIAEIFRPTLFVFFRFFPNFSLTPPSPFFPALPLFLSKIVLSLWMAIITIRATPIVLVCAGARMDCKPLDCLTSYFNAKFHYYSNIRFLTNGLKIRLFSDESLEFSIPPHLCLHWNGNFESNLKWKSIISMTHLSLSFLFSMAAARKKLRYIDIESIFIFIQENKNSDEWRRRKERVSSFLHAFDCLADSIGSFESNFKG